MNVNQIQWHTTAQALGLSKVGTPCELTVSESQSDGQPCGAYIWRGIAIDVMADSQVSRSTHAGRIPTFEPQRTHSSMDLWDIDYVIQQLWGPFV